MPVMDDDRLGRHDLTDEEWARLEPLLPAHPRQGHRWNDHRLVIDGVFYRVRAGCPWRDLPERFGNWKTVYNRHRRWSGTGLGSRSWMRCGLGVMRRRAGRGRWRRMRRWSVDRLSVRAVQEHLEAKHGIRRSVGAIAADLKRWRCEYCSAL
jgi:transposase